MDIQILRTFYLLLLEHDLLQKINKGVNSSFSTQTYIKRQHPLKKKPLKNESNLNQKEEKETDAKRGWSGCSTEGSGVAPEAEKEFPWRPPRASESQSTAAQPPVAAARGGDPSPPSLSSFLSIGN